MRDNNRQVRKMTTLSRKLLGFVAVGLSALLLITNGCSGSENDRIKVSTEAPPALNPREAKALSLAATKVLHEASRARRALQGEAPKPEEALRRLEQGLTLIHIIENTVPWNKVKTEIKAGELVYRNDETDNQAFIPISDSLLALDALVPETDGKAVGGTLPKPPVIERSELGYVALFLDVSLAKEKLETAARQVRADNIQGASESLLAVQTDGVIFELAEVELPLEDAAANLKLAEYDISENLIDAAAVNLTAAAESLEAYELGEGRYAAEARHMHQEIDTLVESLGDSTVSAQGRSGVEEKIAAWWQEIAGWLGPME